MDGVTILNEFSCRGVDASRFVAIIFMAVLMIGFVIYMFIDMWRCTGWIGRIFTTLVWFPFGAIVVLSAIASYNDFTTFHTQYVVTIDDSVGYNEFTERYEITSQDGNVYTVRERENLNEAN